MSNWCTNTLNKLWAISYAVALANVIRMLNWLFPVSGLDIMLKCEEKKTSEFRCSASFTLWHEWHFFFRRSVGKFLEKKKKAWSKIWGLFGNTCLDMWRRKKDAGVGWGRMCKGRELSVDTELLLVFGFFVFFSLWGSAPHNWKNHSWDRQKSIQVGPECTVTNSLSYALYLEVYIIIWWEESIF